MDNTPHFLYRITTAVGDEYIGVSINPSHRLKQHRTGQGNKYLKNRDDLEQIILAKGSREYIYSLEAEYIEKFKPNLNISAGGIGGFNNQKGSNNYQSKLTESLVLEIREYAYNNPNLSYQDIGSRYNISREQVGVICRHQQWAHVGGPKISNRYTSTNNIVDKAKVIDLFNNNYSIPEIVLETGSCKATVYKTLRNSGIDFTLLAKERRDKLVRECHRLRKDKLYLKDIAHRLGISEPTVRKYLRVAL